GRSRQVRDWVGAVTGPGQGRGRAGSGTGQQQGRDRVRAGQVRDRVGAKQGPGRGSNGAGTGSGPGQVRDGVAAGASPGRGRSRPGTGSGPGQVRYGVGAKAGPGRSRGRGRSGTGPRRGRGRAGTGPFRGGVGAASDPLLGTTPVKVAVGSGAAPGTASGGAAYGGAEPRGAKSEGAETGGAEPRSVGTRGGEPGGAELEGVEPGGAASEGAESGGAEPQGVASSGGSASASPRLSPQQLREWFVRPAHLRSGATGAGGAGGAGAGGAGVAAGAGVTGGTAATGPGGAHTQGTGATGIGGVEGAGAGDPTEPGAADAGGAAAGGAGVGGPGAGGAGAAGAGVGGTGAGSAGAAGAGALDPGAGGAGLTEHREPASCPSSSVRTARHVPRPCPPPVPSTHTMTLRPSSVPLCVPLPAPPESFLLEVLDPESDRARATSPTVSSLLATAVTDPSFESAAASVLVAELLDFAATCRLDYATALVAVSVSASPLSIRDECALATDVHEDRQEDFECLAAAVPRFASMLLALRETWMLQTSRPRALTQRRLRRDYVLHSLDFSTAFLQGSLYEEIWLRRPCGFTGTFAVGTQWSLRRPVYSLCQAPREWHDTLRTTLAALGFAPASADPSLFLRTDTSLPPFYVLVYVDDLVFATADTEALTLMKSELLKRHTCTDQGELRSYLGLQITRECGYTFSLGSGSVSWWSTRSSSVLSSSCEAEICAGAMAAQELRWLTYLLTDLGEQPRSPPVLYIDNKAMIALCQEHRLEHRMKHIALGYFLARELRTWPVGPTLLMSSPRHFCLVIISALLLC
ncbi:unnamed protein product, partial [Closterium sp. NIES-53]